MTKSKKLTSKKKTTKKVKKNEKPLITRITDDTKSVAFNDSPDKEFTQEEYIELLNCIRNLQVIFAKKWTTLVSIKTDIPVTYNGMSIDNPFMADIEPQLDSVNSFFDADYGGPNKLLSKLESVKNGQMTFENVGLKDIEDKKKTIKNSLDIVLDDYKNGFKNVIELEKIIRKASGQLHK